MEKLCELMENYTPYAKRDIVFSFTFVVTILLTLLTLGAFGPSLFAILFVVAGIVTVIMLIINIFIYAGV